MDILKSLLDRILKNPTTTIASLAPMIAALIAGWGLNIDTATLTTILSAIYAIILLFLKDHKPPVITSAPIVKPGPTASAIGTPKPSPTIDQAVDGILGRG